MQDAELFVGDDLGAEVKADGAKQLLGVHHQVDAVAAEDARNRGAGGGVLEHQLAQCLVVALVVAGEAFQGRLGEGTMGAAAGLFAIAELVDRAEEDSRRNFDAVIAQGKRLGGVAEQVLAHGELARQARLAAAEHRAVMDEAGDDRQ